MGADRIVDVVTMHFGGPDGSLHPIAVLVLDLDADRLYIRARCDCCGVAGPEGTGVLEAILLDLVADASQRSGSAVLGELEDILSNSIRLSERTRLKVDDVQGALKALFAQHVGGGDGPVPKDFEI